MRRERVSEDIFIFTSGMYAQVTSSVILTDEGAIVIDTLPFPVESREMAEFVRRSSRRGARYVINTHFHGDHVYGNYLFPEAYIVGHRKCREALLQIDEKQLGRIKADNPGLEEVELVPPSIVFDNEMGLHMGERLLRLLHLPGHSPDNIGVYVDGDKILFSGDAVMPVPYFGTGDAAVTRRSLQRILELQPENIVQGHGDTLLRGEIEDTLQRQIAYIDCVEEIVRDYFESGRNASELKEIGIEECGLSAVPLDGFVKQLHLANMVKLYNDLAAA